MLCYPVLHTNGLSSTVSFCLPFPSLVHLSQAFAKEELDPKTKESVIAAVKASRKVAVFPNETAAVDVNTVQGKSDIYRLEWKVPNLRIKGEQKHVAYV